MKIGKILIMLLLGAVLSFSLFACATNDNNDGSSSGGYSSEFGDSGDSTSDSSNSGDSSGDSGDNEDSSGGNETPRVPV